jgi:DNA polymerase elongation subunit (family B)
MHLWELKDGKTTHEVIEHKISYYIEDKTKTSPIKDIYGTYVTQQFTDSRNKLKSIKEAYGKLFESDLSEEVKFLHERYKDQKDEIDYQQYKVANIDIEIQGGNEFPKPEQAKYPINLITVDDYRNDKITTFGLHPYTGEVAYDNYIYCETEEILLQNFIQHFRKEKYAVCTGWFICGFDWPYIINRCKNLEIDYTKLSPIGKVKCNQKKNGDWKIEIAGLYLLDSMDLYKKFSYQNQPSYNLNYIAMQEINEGKLDYDGQINDLWARDWNLFVDYNVQDCLLVRKIEAKRKFIDLAINLGVQTRTPFDRVYSTISVVEGYLLRYLHRDNIIFPDRLKQEEGDEEESIEGGYVFVIPGFYINLSSIDATSLYPHEIMMNNISPETKVLNPSEEMKKDLIRTPIEGVYYRKDIKGILPKMVSDIFKERKHFQALKKEAKAEHNEDLVQYYDSQQLIRKILINSVYGVLLNSYFHFYDADNGAVITAGGRDAIQYISNCINTYLHSEFYKISKKYYPNSNLQPGDIEKVTVVLNDTDSASINLNNLYQKTHQGESFLDWMLNFEKVFFNDFLVKCMDIYAKNYNTTNMIHFKREKIITKMYVQAKKKYITQIVANEGDIYDPPETKVTGVEINKSDLCSYSRKKLKELADIMFAGDVPNKDDMTKFVRKCYKEFKTTKLEDISSPKGVSDYDKYAIPMTLPFEFAPHTPMAHKSGIIYNYIVREHKLPLMEVTNGSKLKYVYVYPNNKYKTNVIGYIGNYPKEFDKHFRIDLETQFEKQFLNVAQRMFDTLGFGVIQLKDSKIKNLFA